MSEIIYNSNIFHIITLRNGTKTLSAQNGRPCGKRWKKKKVKYGVLPMRMLEYYI